MAVFEGSSVAPPHEIPVSVAEEGILLEYELLLLHRQLQREAGVAEDTLRGFRRPMVAWSGHDDKDIFGDEGEGIKKRCFLTPTRTKARVVYAVQCISYKKETKRTDELITRHVGKNDRRFFIVSFRFGPENALPSLYDNREKL